MTQYLFDIGIRNFMVFAYLKYSLISNLILVGEVVPFLSPCFTGQIFRIG